VSPVLSPSAFHFLRPEWLWLALPSALVVFLLLRRDDPVRPFRGIVAPHLLPHLLVGVKRGFHVQPVHLLAAFLAIATLALAGPTWQREAPPFALDRAALVIALDLSHGMDATDVQPTRLERAKQKLRDLLALREGSRSALVAYAGTAHTVLPLTDDRKILETYLEALGTGLMPVRGKDAPAALGLAESLLAKETVPGTILFMTDGISKAQVPAFLEARRAPRNQLVVLGIGTTEGGPVHEGKGFASEGGRPVVARLDREGLLELGRETGALVATATLDDRDVRRIQRAIETPVESAKGEDGGAGYRDFGWYAAPFLAIVAGLWFRRGFTLRWAAILACCWLSPAASEGADFHFADLWATRDQQGRRHFERGNYKRAAELFRDPIWKGTACYRAGDYACAADAFASVDTPEAWYGLGNAYARQGELKLAVSAYDRALAARPDFADAKANRDLVARRIPRPGPGEQEGQAPAPDQKLDEAKLDGDGARGKRGEVEVNRVTDEPINQIWLRGVQTSPADFLRRKFALQATRSRAAAERKPAASSPPSPAPSKRVTP
jgi:Ca-activated chloride channel family protein